MQRTWRTTCQRTVMNVRRAANLFRGSRAGATFAPHEVPTPCAAGHPALGRVCVLHLQPGKTDRKSTRLNSSHSQISYAVFCLKKKKHRSRTTATHSQTTSTSVRY